MQIGENTLVPRVLSFDPGEGEAIRSKLWISPSGKLATDWIRNLVSLLPLKSHLKFVR